LLLLSLPKRKFAQGEVGRKACALAEPDRTLLKVRRRVTSWPSAQLAVGWGEFKANQWCGWRFHRTDALAVVFHRGFQNLKLSGTDIFEYLKISFLKAHVKRQVTPAQATAYRVMEWLADPFGATATFGRIAVRWHT
jgi:hypothetical protein